MALLRACDPGSSPAPTTDSDERFDHVRVRTWRADDASWPPELRDPELAVPWLAERPSFGIAFSGGGSRSATATLGQLRALHRLGWLKKARWVGASSGSTWTLIPWVYLPTSHDETIFLGPYLPPEALTEATLRPETPVKGAMETVLHDARIGRPLLRSSLRGDETWSGLIGSVFLAPFGLNDRDQVFTFHREARDRILAANPQLRTDDILVVERRDRPYPVLIGTLLVRQTSNRPDDRHPLELTPLATGLRPRVETTKDDERVVLGGGQVETFGYDSYEPDPVEAGPDGRVRVRLEGSLRRGELRSNDRYRFTLSDLIGVSSAAPAAGMVGHHVPNELFPEHRHWPVDPVDRSRPFRRKADEYVHADGGVLDNLGVLPLLARRAESLLVFINTSVPFVRPADGCGAVTAGGDDDDPPATFVDDLISLFRPTRKLPHNVVFDGDGLERICETFSEQQARGEPLVHCERYAVAANARYGIAPHEASTCWMYLDRSTRWTSAITADGKRTAALADGTSPFDTFPHYDTFTEQTATPIDLDRERVVALTNLTAWSVLERAETIREALPDAGLSSLPSTPGER